MGHKIVDIDLANRIDIASEPIGRKTLFSSGQYWLVRFADIPQNVVKKDRAFKANQGAGMNIFVGNLPATVTTGDLRRLFDGYGTIINAIVVRDAGTGLPLGYGHVYLVPEESAYEAIVTLHNTMLKGGPVTVRECVYRAEPERRGHHQLWKGVERRAAGSRRHHGYEFPDTITRQQHAG